jgi:Na+/proline symporter
MSNSLQTLITMAVYLAAMIVIGVFFHEICKPGIRKLLYGGRKLGPWVAAMSASLGYERWLLMGLPGVRTGAAWQTPSGRRWAWPSHLPQLAVCLKAACATTLWRRATPSLSPNTSATA